jgi:hypothetical protein
MKIPIYSQPSWVRAGDYGWVDASRVEVVDVSSDEFGRDVYEFTFRGESYSSIVARGSQPG